MSETTTMEKWELQELVDDAVAIGQLRPEMLSEYIYEFEHRGKQVRDLTAASYHQIALEQGLTTEKITREDMEEGVFYEVWVTKPQEGVDKELWERKVGVSYEPYKVGNRFDRFCFQKALTKATRNAVKQFVTANARHKAINALQGLDIIPMEEVHVPSDTVPTIEDEALNLYRHHKERLNNGGISDELFWSAVQERYNAATRGDMSEAQWRDLIESLSYISEDGTETPFAQWIHDLTPF